MIGKGKAAWLYLLSCCLVAFPIHAKGKRKVKNPGLIAAIVLGGGAALWALTRKGTSTVVATVAPPGPVPVYPPPEPLPVGGGGTQTDDIVFSMMGLRDKTIDGWRVIEWPGIVPAGKVHPRWDGLASSMRDSEGRLLPALLRKYGLKNARRIGVVGFSAGSNSGLREFLRHPKDRAALSFAVAADGIHAMLRPGVNPKANALSTTDYADFQSQMGPVFEMAKQAGQGGAPMVITASAIERPASGVTRSAEGLQTIMVQVNPVRSSWHKPPAIDVGTNPTGYNSGNLYTYFTEGRDAAEHIRHAKSIPSLLRALVFPTLKGTV